MNIDDYLTALVRSGSPDLHIKTGRVPLMRLNTGELHEMENTQVLSAQMVEEMLLHILPEAKKAIYLSQHEVDLSYFVLGLGRFRVNIYLDSDGPALAFRAIPEIIPNLVQMGMPEIVRKLTTKHKGLIVVTGPTGSGKSTSLAAMLNEINETRRAHIITVEDPIEFLHKPKQSLITQREVGAHTLSFPNAIRSAMRQDPDVLLVGEMRDLETIAAAITLAETGHLVLATLHTQDAAQTIDRIIDVFPTHQQAQIRTQLSSSLVGVVAQRLLPKADKSGRVLALEVLVNNSAVTNCIKEGKTHQIYSMMQIGKEDGMITLDASLSELFKTGVISEETLRSWAKDSDLALNLSKV